MQLERVERVEKVEDAVGEQAGDYERLLRRMGERRDAEKEKGTGRSRDGRQGNKGEGVIGGVENVVEADAGTARRRERGKRKILDDDDEEMEGTPEPKKVKETG